MSNAYPNLYHCIYHSPLGAMYMHSCGKALRALYFERQKYHQTYENPESKELQTNDLEIFTQTKLWLDRYFSGQIPDFVPKLAPNGSDFAKQVWRILQGISYGMIMTYGEIAKILAKNRAQTQAMIDSIDLAESKPLESSALDSSFLTSNLAESSTQTFALESNAPIKLPKMSAQAVGGAVGRNPIAIIIPCHRVMGANANLTGYAGGIDKKIKLLELEGADTKRFKMPKIRG